MTTRLAFRQIVRIATVFLSVSFVGYMLVYSQSGGGQSTFALPFTIDEFKSQMEITAIRISPERYIKEVERRKIAFLPTRELKDELAKTSIPKAILDALNFKNVAFFLQVSQFTCGGCSTSATDGESFGQQVLDEIKEVTLKSSADSNPLFKKAYLARLGPIGGVEKSDTPHVYILISGKLSKEGPKERIGVDLAYINAGYMSKTGISAKMWTATGSFNRQTIAKQIAEWVADSLKAAMD